MSEHIQANRKLWDAWTKIHEHSDFYNNEGFKAGQTSLKSIELEELGEVQGKSLLHLQCHFGQDTLSWARLGAQVTGVDFSSNAIKLARSMAEDLEIRARFICSDIFTLPDILDEKFDVVFTSYGVLAWLGNLNRWADVIAKLLKPGGTFYIVEIHPFASILDDWETKPKLGIRYPYFYSAEPLAFDAVTSYAEPDASHTEPITNFQWDHSMGDILNAIIGSGLQIKSFNEYPKTVFKQLAFMEEHDGWWCLPEGLPEIPLLFSLKATQPT